MSEQLQYSPSYIIREKPMDESLQFFLKELEKIPNARVLEAGTRRWGAVPTHHQALFTNASKYTRIDLMDGEDVDKVCDVHEMTKSFQVEPLFDVFWASSVWEHLHSPWIAAQEVLNILKPGGIFFIQTHFVFPEHGYPHDYFRFTTEGLKRLFQGASKTVASYDYACDINPWNKDLNWNPNAPAFLNVNLAGIK